MYKFLVFFLFVFAAFSCGTKDKPVGILPKEKMADILIEVHLAEAKANFYQFKTVDSSKVLFLQYKKDLLLKQGVAPAVFDSSYNYYARNVKDFNDIYLKVIDNLTQREASNKID